MRSTKPKPTPPTREKRLAETREYFDNVLAELDHMDQEMAHILQQRKIAAAANPHPPLATTYPIWTPGHRHTVH